MYFFFSERAVEYDCYTELGGGPRGPRLQGIDRRRSSPLGAPAAAGLTGRGAPPGLPRAAGVGARALQRGQDHVLKARLSVLRARLALLQLAAGAAHAQGASWHNTTFFGVFRARW